jgi:nucleotide-binding universal stress UspA family protein
MFKNILIPIDGSENGQLALAEGLRLAEGFQPGVRITVLFVIRPVPVNEFSIALGPDQSGREEGEAVLKKASAFLAGGTVAHELLAVNGDPAAEICNRAATAHHDLIVMGNRGRSLVQELLLGSVSHSVLQKAPCAVLIVRH